jgi:hypothetical protein
MSVETRLKKLEEAHGIETACPNCELRVEGNKLFIEYLRKNQIVVPERKNQKFISVECARCGRAGIYNVTGYSDELIAGFQRFHELVKADYEARRRYWSEETLQLADWLFPAMEEIDRQIYGDRYVEATNAASMEIVARHGKEVVISSRFGENE